MKSKKIKKISAPPSSLQNDQQSSAVFPGHGKDFGKFLTTGHWTSTNPESDKKLKELTQFVENPPGVLKDAKKQIIVDGKRYIDFQNQWLEKQKEQNKKTLMFTLIDPKNRETERLANNIFPELQKTADEYFLERLELQKKLYRMIQRGTFESREELQDFYNIMKDSEFVLPLGPSWDPDRIIVDVAPLLRSNLKNARRAIWNPKNIYNSYSRNKNANNDIRTDILRSLYGSNSVNFEEFTKDKDYAEFFLKLALAARVCPMFYGRDVRKYSDFRAVIDVLYPIMMGDTDDFGTSKEKIFAPDE